MPNTQEQINLFSTLRWTFVGKNSQKLISTEKSSAAGLLPIWHVNEGRVDCQNIRMGISRAEGMAWNQKQM